MPIPIWAGHYIGLPFSEHGRGAAGVDCWGLVRLVMAEQFGRALPSYVGEYRTTMDKNKIAALIERTAQDWQEIEKGREALGDVIVLRLNGKPMHVGLVLGDGHMLHIERFINSAIERYTDTRWKDRIHSFYRYKP